MSIMEQFTTGFIN